MAVKVGTPVKGELNTITEFTFEAATTASDGVKYVLPKVTEEYVKVLVANTNASTAYDITLKKPTTGSYAASSSDEVHELAAGEFAFINIESARFANRDGSILLVPEHADVKVAVIY